MDYLLNYNFCRMVWKANGKRDNDTLLKSDVTRRDHVSVVMDAGSRIVNFIRDGTVFV